MAIREARESDLEALAPLLRGYADFYESNPSDEAHPAGDLALSEADLRRLHRIFTQALD